MNSKNPVEYFILFLKGMAMGAADVVPGVSGGTIAFISGIYEELIETIHKIDLDFLRLWKKQGFLIAWKNYNLNFLLVLFSGVLVSIISLAQVIGWLLVNEPILVWAFFFGLVVASIYYIGKQIKPWNLPAIIGFILAAGISYYITLAEPITSPDSNWFIFFSGFIAIIAMILPGISGSFILLLLGSYQVILNTINELSSGISALNWSLVMDSALRLLIFAVGAVLGIKAFSKVLNWLFKHYKNITLSILTGFMLGALNKIWPWKEAISWREDSAGEPVVLLEESISPMSYAGDPQILWAIIFAIIGFLSIFLLELVAQKKEITP